MSELSVREYLRVSRDRSGEGKSPDQQHDDNLRSIAQNGWALHPLPPYRDDDRSASRFATKTREDFGRLIDDLEHHTFGAEILAIWESSRGSRRVGEWVDLVDLCKRRGVRIWVTTHGRLYDPAVARDRRSLLEDAVDAEYESDKTSERLLRSVRAAAELGKPHGKNLYGYRRVYDPQTRRLLRIEEHPEQAPIVKEAAQRILRGDSFYAVARDLNERGVPARRPARKDHRTSVGWTPPAVKQMLSTAAYGGKRLHKGEIVSDAVWPALIEFETWERLQALMSPKSRRRTNDWPAAHLLAGIAICSVCGAPLRVGRQNAGKRTLDDSSTVERKTYLTYVCPGVPGRPGPNGKKGFHVGMRKELLDEAIIELLFKRLEQPDFLARQEVDEENVRTERDSLLDEINSYRSYLDQVRDQAAQEMRFELILDQEKRLAPKIAAAERRLAQLTATDPLIMQILADGGVRERWASMKLADQRRVVRAILTPVVKPIGRDWRGKRGMNWERIEVLWR